MTEEQPVDRWPTERWEDVGAESEFAVGEAREVRIGARRIAVIRVGEAWYAIKNICPHAGVELHRGRLIDAGGSPVIECSGHGWTFSLESGACISAGVDSRVASYPVKIEQGRVLIGV